MNTILIEINHILPLIFLLKIVEADFSFPGDFSSDAQFFVFVGRNIENIYFYKKNFSYFDRHYFESLI